MYISVSYTIYYICIYYIVSYDIVYMLYYIMYYIYYINVDPPSLVPYTCKHFKIINPLHCHKGVLLHFTFDLSTILNYLKEK